MKTRLLPYYCKAIGVALLASSGLFLYLNNAIAVTVAISIGILIWLVSAERIEDERVAQQRLLAIRASVLVTVLFEAVFGLLVVGGYSSIPSLFCVLPISLITYIAAFYRGTLIVTKQDCEE